MRRNVMYEYKCVVLCFLDFYWSRDSSVLTFGLFYSWGIVTFLFCQGEMSWVFWILSCLRVALPDLTFPVSTMSIIWGRMPDYSLRLQGVTLLLSIFLHLLCNHCILLLPPDVNHQFSFCSRRYYYTLDTFRYPLMFWFLIVSGVSCLGNVVWL